MRERVLQLLTLTYPGFDESIYAHTAALRDQFERAFQQAVPPEADAALRTLEAALVARKGELVDAVVAVYQELFTTDEIEAAIEHYSSPIAKRLGELRAPLMDKAFEAEDAWLRRTIGGCNVDLERLLGGNTTAAPLQDMTPG